ENNDNDASPSEFGVDSRGVGLDAHGTAVAGIIGASANNGIGGVGIAYESNIFGFKTYGSNTSLDRFLLQTAAAIHSTYDPQNTNHHADIINMSIGTSFAGNFFDEQTAFSPNMAVLNQTINNAAALGRNTLGTILVKSAGNSRADNQNTNSSSWNANPHTISVAAIEQSGFVSEYSTPGSSLLVSAFGTPGQVVTTDRIGTEGYNRDFFENDYTNGFNGTSAAAPMVSGVVALMLEANPNLGWRDVQEILAYSARHVGSPAGTRIDTDEKYIWDFNGADNWNGGGLHFSNDYGFGLVDAKAAVRLAETWNVAPQTSHNTVAISQDFLDGQAQLTSSGGSSQQVVNNSLDIEHVEVTVSFTQWVDHGDLGMRLISPTGTSSILINQSGNDNESFVNEFSPRQWTFVSNEFRGEDTAGAWTIELFDMDNLASSPIVIDDINITFRGQAASWNDTFIFTEEYSNYAGGPFGHSRMIDGGIGIDRINAAAVDSNTVINLTSGTGQIDGIAVGVVGVENVFSGDGNDQLIGNHLQNNLIGMRGNDWLMGGAGSDFLAGGKGNDVLIGANPSDWGPGYGEYDILTGGEGADVFVLGNTSEAFYAGVGHALITDFDWLDGDLFQVHGAIGEYSLGSSNVAGGLSQDTLIYHHSDLVGVVQDNTDVDLTLDFAFV
ncbi:MAG: S8 family serine peptidase, partial [Leptolyngbya sp. SIO3F4]|nr:S8 family serine peptidase [Leptolyngbya sp. SIO3F4]